MDYCYAFRKNSSFYSKGLTNLKRHFNITSFFNKNYKNLPPYAFHPAMYKVLRSSSPIAPFYSAGVFVTDLFQ